MHNSSWTWAAAVLLLFVMLLITAWALRHEPLKEEVTLKDFPICIVCGNEVTHSTAGATVPMQVGSLPLVAIYCKDHVR